MKEVDLGELLVSMVGFIMKKGGSSIMLCLQYFWHAWCKIIQLFVLSDFIRVSNIYERLGCTIYPGILRLLQFNIRAPWSSKHQQLVKIGGENDAIFEALLILKFQTILDPVTHNTSGRMTGAESLTRPFLTTPIMRRRKPERPDMRNLLLKALRRRSTSVQWISSTIPTRATLYRIPSISRLCALTVPAITSGELGITQDHVPMPHFTHIPKMIDVNNPGIQAEKDSSEEIQSDFTWNEGALKSLVLIDVLAEKNAPTELVDGKYKFHFLCSRFLPLSSTNRVDLC